MSMSRMPITRVGLPGTTDSKSLVFGPRRMLTKSGACGATTVLATMSLNSCSLSSRYSRNRSSEGGRLPSDFAISASASVFPPVDTAAFAPVTE